MLSGNSILGAAPTIGNGNGNGGGNDKGPRPDDSGGRGPGEGPPVELSQVDRVLVGVAYLGYFLGFWVIAPLVVFAFRRDSSRFVAHHALRAVLLHLMVMPVGIASWIAGMVVAVAGVGVMEAAGLKGDGAAFAILGLTLVAYLTPLAIYLWVCVRATARAVRGELDTRAFLAPTVERWLGPEKPATR